MVCFCSVRNRGNRCFFALGTLEQCTGGKLGLELNTIREHRNANNGVGNSWKNLRSFEFSCLGDPVSWNVMSYFLGRSFWQSDRLIRVTMPLLLWWSSSLLSLSSWTAPDLAPSTFANCHQPVNLWSLMHWTHDLQMTCIVRSLDADERSCCLDAGHQWTEVLCFAGWQEANRITSLVSACRTSCHPQLFSTELLFPWSLTSLSKNWSLHHFWRTRKKGSNATNWNKKAHQNKFHSLCT